MQTRYYVSDDKGGRTKMTEKGFKDLMRSLNKPRHGRRFCIRRSVVKPRSGRAFNVKICEILS